MKNLILSLAVMILSAACGSNGSSDQSKNGSIEDIQSSGAMTSNEKDEAYSENNPVASKGVELSSDAQPQIVRLVPEQIKKQMVLSSGYSHSEESEWLFSIFHTHLGGLDHNIKKTRTLTVGINEVLSLGTISFAFSKNLVQLELSKPRSERLFFQDVDISTDLPIEGKGLEQWKKQVIEIYWRFFSRPPLSSELVDLQSAFLEIYSFEYADFGMERSEAYKVSKSWILTLTVLFSSMEYWNA